MIPNHEYIFSYMTNKNSLTFDGHNVLIKQGPFRKTTFPFNNILNWYVYDDKTYRSMFITYTSDAGKQKKIQLFTQHGEQGFHALIDGFNQTIPTKCLNHLEKKEAFKIMKAADPKKVGALGAFIVIFILTTVFMSSGLRHYFDFGFEERSIDEVIAGEYDTRNLDIMGYPLQETLEETYTKSGSTTYTYYVPLVNDMWEDDQPIPVIMKFSEDVYNSYDEDATAFKGVVRDLWMEGADQDVKDFFGSEYGFEVNDDVILFEVTGEEHNDSLMFFIWLGINGIFVVLLGVVYLRSK